MNNSNDNIRDQIKLTNGEQLYQITDENGQIVGYETASGRQLFNHYRHNMTNYDQVLDRLHDKQGHVSGWQQKQAAVGAAEKILESYRNEHVKVIKDSQQKGHFLKVLMQKAGVATASSLVNFLDICSEKIKEISHLESSQRSLQVWNDAYRVQHKLTKELLIREGVSQEIIDKVNAIYSTRSSIKNAIALYSDFFNLEKSEVLKLIKDVVRYTKL